MTSQFIDSHRFRFLGIYLLIFYALDRRLFFLSKLLPPDQRLKVIIFLELNDFLGCFLYLLDLFLLFFPFLVNFDLNLSFSDFLLLPDQILNGTGPTKNMPMSTADRLDKEVIADCAHLKFLEGILTHSLLLGTIFSFQFLFLSICEDRLRCIIL